MSTTLLDSNQSKLKNSPCLHCGRYDNRPVSIDALIIRDGNILLIKRRREPYKGIWALPGGHIDWDETVEEATIREVREEVGLMATRVQLLGVYSDPKRHPKQAIAVAFICVTSGEPKAGDDAVEARFFSLDNLPAPLAFDHEKIVEDFRSSQLNH